MRMPTSYPSPRLFLTAPSGDRRVLRAEDVIHIFDEPSGATILHCTPFDPDGFIRVVESAATVEQVLTAARHLGRSFQQAHLNAILSRYSSLKAHPLDEVRLVYEALWDLNPDVMANLVAGGSFLFRALGPNAGPTVLSAELVHDLTAIKLT